MFGLLFVAIRSRAGSRIRLLDIVHLFSLCEYKVLRLPLVNVLFELLKATTTTSTW